MQLKSKSVSDGWHIFQVVFNEHIANALSMTNTVSHKQRSKLAMHKVCREERQTVQIKELK